MGLEIRKAIRCMGFCTYSIVTKPLWSRTSSRDLGGFQNPSYPMSVPQIDRTSIDLSNLIGYHQKGD